MMARRLAGFFASLALMVLIGSWLLRHLHGLPRMPPDKLVMAGFLVFVLSFPVGYFIAKLGISLVQEVLEERRNREEERRHRARVRYQELLGGEQAEAGSGAEEGGAPPPRGAESA